MTESHDGPWTPDNSDERQRKGYAAIEACLEELAGLLAEVSGTEMPMVTDWVLLTEWSTLSGFVLSRWAKPNVPVWRQRALQMWDLDSGVDR